MTRVVHNLVIPAEIAARPPRTGSRAAHRRPAHRVRLRIGLPRLTTTCHGVMPPSRVGEDCCPAVAAARRPPLRVPSVRCRVWSLIAVRRHGR